MIVFKEGSPIICNGELVAYMSKSIEVESGMLNWVGPPSSLSDLDRDRTGGIMVVDYENAGIQVLTAVIAGGNAQEAFAGSLFRKVAHSPDTEVANAWQTIARYGSYDSQESSQLAVHIVHSMEGMSYQLANGHANRILKS